MTEFNYTKLDKNELERAKLNLEEREAYQKFGDQTIIEFNIDGRIYKTLRNTILKFESVMRTMIIHRENAGITSEVDSEGRILFNSVPNAEYFKYILLFFRSDSGGNQTKEPITLVDQEIDHKFKLIFKRITESFNLANFLEFYEICNFFCVKILVTLIENRIAKFNNCMEIDDLSEKYRNIEQEVENYGEAVNGNYGRLEEIDNLLTELRKKIQDLEIEKNCLLETNSVMVKEKSLLDGLLEMKQSFSKKTNEEKFNDNQLIDTTFDVGGQLFTFKSTELEAYKSSLLFMLMKQNEKSSKPIFVDRDPSLFIDIYKFIKKGIIPITSAALIEETKYFRVDALTVEIDWLRYPVEELSDQDREMRETESILRRLFSFDKENPLIAYPYVNLISVFDNISDFQPVITSKTEDILLENPYVVNQSMYLSESLEQFNLAFNGFTKNIFHSLDWNGIFIAGGSIQASVAGIYYYVHDVDIFLYGLSQTEAEDKIRHIYNILKLQKENIIIIRSENAITFKAEGMVIVQVITRLYKSCAEILIGFDIDSCCVGYDGNKVWCLPRFKRAVTHRYNLLDVERQSYTYCSRLSKYSYRGFRVKVPGYRPDKVQILPKHPKSRLSGLALLLYYDSYAQISRQKTSKHTESENNLENEISDYTDYLCYWITSYPFSLTQSLYNSYILHAKKLNFILTNNDLESIINSSSILQPLHAITPTIAWIIEQPGRQLLGSLHPVFDNFYASAFGDFKQNSTPERKDAE